MTEGPRQRIRAPLIAIALTIPIVLFFNWLLFDREPGGYEVTAEFADASGLVKNSIVKVGGADAGTITRLELTEDDTALATIKLEEEAGVVGEGARAAARPVNLLGEKYIDLDPGDASKPLERGARIPLEDTSTPVELDDVLAMLDSPTRARLRILINEAGIAMAGRGSDFNRLLEELPPAADELRKVVGELDAEREQLAAVIEEGDRILRAVASRRDDLGRLVTRAAETLTVTASRREQLAEAVRQAPRALGELRSALAELDLTASRLRPAAADLESAAPPLAETLAALPGFAGAAERTLATARKIAPRLERLGRRATPTVRRLTPTAQRLARTAGDADPIAEQLAEGGTFDHLLGTMHGWANAVKTEDGASNLFGIQVIATENLVRNVIDRYVASMRGNPGRARANRATGAAARVRSAPDDASAPSVSAPDRASQALSPHGVGGGNRGRLLDALDGLRRAADVSLRDLRELTNRQLRELLDLPRSRALELLQDVASGKSTRGKGDAGKLANPLTDLLDFLLGP